MEKQTDHPATEADSVEPNSIESASPVREFLKKWVVYRLPALSAWIWLIMRIAGLQFPFEQRYENYLLLPSVVAFVLLILTRNWVLVPFYPFYFPLSPLLLVFLPIGFVIRTLTGTPEDSFAVGGIVRRIYLFLRSAKTIILLVLVVFASWVAINYVGTAYRPIFALSAHIATYLLFLESFRWAANPYKPILLGIKFVSRMGEKLIRKVLKVLIEPQQKKRLPERESTMLTLEKLEEGLRQLHDPKKIVSRGITSFTHGGLSAIFTIFFFSFYLATAVSFAFSLLEIERSWGKIISGISEGQDIMSYIYFSLLSQATAVPDGIHPLSPYGQLWIMWLVMTGVLSLTGLITLFTSSAGAYSESAINEISLLFDEMVEKVRIFKADLLHFPEPK